MAEEKDIKQQEHDVVYKYVSSYLKEFPKLAQKAGIQPFTFNGYVVGAFTKHKWKEGITAWHAGGSSPFIYIDAKGHCYSAFVYLHQPAQQISFYEAAESLTKEFSSDYCQSRASIDEPLFIPLNAEKMVKNRFSAMLEKR